MFKTLLIHNHHHQLFLNREVVGAPHMISQLVSSIFLCSPLPSGTWRIQACPFPNVVFPPLPLSALSSSYFHCALQDGFGQTWWTGDLTIPLQFASLYNGQVFVWSNCLLDLGTDFLVGNMVFSMRCVISCGSTSFPWLVIFFGALLWGSMIHKYTGRWMWQGSALVVSWNWERYSGHSKLVSTLSLLQLSVLPWRVSLKPAIVPLLA